MQVQMINRRALNSIRKWKFAIIIEMTRITTENTRQRFWISQKLTFGNLVGFSTYSSDFDLCPDHVGRSPTGLLPSSFREKWGTGEGYQFLSVLVTKLMEHLIVALDSYRIETFNIEHWSFVFCLYPSNWSPLWTLTNNRRSQVSFSSGLYL